MAKQVTKYKPLARLLREKYEGHIENPQRGRIVKIWAQGVETPRGDTFYAFSSSSNSDRIQDHYFNASDCGGDSWKAWRKFNLAVTAFLIGDHITADPEAGDEWTDEFINQAYRECCIEGERINRNGDMVFTLLYEMSNGKEFSPQRKCQFKRTGEQPGGESSETFYYMPRQNTRDRRTGTDLGVVGSYL